MPTLEQPLELYDLVSDPEIRRAAAKTLKGFCLTYLAHHFPLDPSDFFDEMCMALESNDIKRLEIIGFRGCAKSTVASLALVLWAALEHPNKYPFIIMLADTRSQASINNTRRIRGWKINLGAAWSNHRNGSWNTSRLQRVPHAGVSQRRRGSD